MGGKDGDDLGSGEQGGDLAAADAGVAEPGDRRRQPRLDRGRAAILGKVGEQRESEEAADEAQRVVEARQAGEARRQRRVGSRAGSPVGGDGGAADALDLGEYRVALGGADDVAQQPPEEAQVVALVAVGQRRTHGIIT